MNTRPWLRLFATIALAGTILVGCETNPAGPPEETAPSPGLQEPFAMVSFQIVLPASPGSSRAQVFPNVSPAKATIRLNLIDRSQASPTITVSKTVEVSSQGTAHAVFGGLIPLPLLATVQIDGGRIGSWTDFLGAADLVPGSNTVTLAPRGSGLPVDLIARLVEFAMGSPERVHSAPADIVGFATLVVGKLPNGTSDPFSFAQERFLSSSPIEGIAIQSPSAGTKVAAGSPLQIVASLSVTGRSISEISFTANGTFLGIATSPDFSLTTPLPQTGQIEIIALGTDSRGLSFRSPSVTIQVLDGPPRISPQVELRSPLFNGTIIRNERLDLIASASDQDGTVARVEFFLDGSPLGIATQQPFSIPWLPTQEGFFHIQVQATDDQGNTSSMFQSPITVVSPPNKPPLVVLTGPIQGFTQSMGKPLSIVASPSDPDGFISKVEYYCNGLLIGVATQSPWAISWVPTASGQVQIVARSIDDDGASTDSSKVIGTLIELPNQAPQISLSSPTQLNIPVTGEPVSITALATDSDGSITRVDILLNGVTLKTLTSPPFKTAWTPTVPGVYSISAIAIDNKGSQATTPSVSITVRRGLFISSPGFRSIVFVGTWWGPGVSISGTFDFIASLTLSVEGAGMPSARISRARKAERSRPSRNKDLPLDLRIAEMNQRPVPPSPRPRASVRAGFGDLPILATETFYVNIDDFGYMPAEFFKLAQNDQCIVFGMKDYGTGIPCITTDSAGFIARAFGEANPFHPQQQSIIACDRENFGTEWHLDGGRDGEARIIILVFDERLAPSGLMGYYRPTDANYPRGTSTSNGGEILYLSNGTITADGFDACATLAHEFQHMITDNQSRIREGTFAGSSPLLFFTEGCSMMAEDINGFGWSASDGPAQMFIDQIWEGLKKLWIGPLAAFDGYSCDYGRGYLFVKYLQQRIGQAGLRSVISAGGTKTAIESSMPGGVGPFLTDWSTAMLLSGKSGTIPENLVFTGLDFYRTVPTRDGDPVQLSGPLVSNHTIAEISGSRMSTSSGEPDYLEVETQTVPAWTGRFFIDLPVSGVTLRGVVFDGNQVESIVTPEWLTR